MKIRWAVGAMVAGVLAFPAWVEAKPRMIPETQEIDEGGAKAGAPAEAPPATARKTCPACQGEAKAEGSVFVCCGKTLDADGKEIACEACAKAARKDVACEPCKVTWGAGRAYACAGCAEAAKDSAKRRGQEVACAKCDNVTFRNGRIVAGAGRAGRQRRGPRIQEGGGGAE